MSLLLLLRSPTTVHPASGSLTVTVSLSGAANSVRNVSGSLSVSPVLTGTATTVKAVAAVPLSVAPTLTGAASKTALTSGAALSVGPLTLTGSAVAIPPFLRFETTRTELVGAPFFTVLDNLATLRRRRGEGTPMDRLGGQALDGL